MRKRKKRKSLHIAFCIFLDDCFQPTSIYDIIISLLQCTLNCELPNIKKSITTHLNMLFL